MEEQAEIFEVLKSFRAVLEQLESRVEAIETTYQQVQEKYDERFAKLEDVFYNQILAKAEEAMKEKAEEDELAAYKAKYDSKFDGVRAGVQAIEGADFDPTKQTLAAWKEYAQAPHEGEEVLTEESFVEAMVQDLALQINKMREGLGISPDADVEVSSDEEGKTEVKVDGEPVVEAEETPAETPVEPEAKEEEVSEEKDEEETEDEMSPEEVAALEAEMKKEGLI